MVRKAINNEQASRFQKVFDAYLRGDRPVSTTHDSQLFLEAAREQPTPSACVEKIIASPSGLRAVRHSVRASDNPRFISSHVLPFILYLSHPDVKSISEGKLLQQIVTTIVDPPTAWSAILGLYVEHGFVDADNNAETFAWLCLQIFTSAVSELIALAKELTTTLQKRPLLDHACHKVREYGQQIRKILKIQSSIGAATAIASDTETPGGRHDNDFADFRQISVYPTTDELASTRRPFYRRATEIAVSEPLQRAREHVDNQYRLLREDMLAELRDGIQMATGKKKKKGRYPAQALGELGLLHLDSGDEKRGRVCTLLVTVRSGLEFFHGMDPKQRRDYLVANTNILRHQAFGALCSGDVVIGFAFVHRDIDRLAEDPPVVGLQFTSSEVLVKVIDVFRMPQNLRFVLVDTPVFAYEPVLQRLKDITVLPLESQILRLDDHDTHVNFSPPEHLGAFLQRCQNQPSKETHTLQTGDTKCTLDVAQFDALVYALSTPLSTIQGPPGTGKSFIGGLASKMLLGSSSGCLLVLSYTNHALDQFLEDLLKIGIRESDMTRLGSKFSAATAPLSFEPQFRASKFQHGKKEKSRLYRAKEEVNDTRDEVTTMFEKTMGRVSWVDILDQLKFSDDPQEQLFWRAFEVPTEDDGFVRSGKKGKVIKEDYLINIWRQGNDPGVLQQHVSPECRPVWDIPTEERARYVEKWGKSLRAERIEGLRGLINRLNEAQGEVDFLFNEARRSFITKKRVIGCTTTAAAKYSSLIKAAKPNYVLVEEAGEIQEAHVLTALSPNTKQLILIGDHKQLRPKCNNYALSVEKGDGYDLNRSMFERLIIQGHHHVTLRTQHRMDPEISQLVRAMTYPELLDGERTNGRPLIRGINGRVAFINHDQPEVDAGEIRDARDAGYKASKRNRFEAKMVLKFVKYLGQQGYKTSDMVVLTPYLGQLRLLRDMLSTENDPLLSYLDSFELVRAGLLTSAAGKVEKGQIRLSTIDNYQGEESDIVIASLTRSNSRGDIGFMKAAERLNVLVSRARNGLIVFGNMDTFMKSSQGKDTWVPFFKLLKEKQYLKDGLLVHCEQHPDRTAMLSNPRDFDQKCPDGGCSEPCGAKLKCGIHICQLRCHRLRDHSKIPCDQLVDKTCEKGHHYKVRCEEDHVCCDKCRKEEEDVRRRTNRDLQIEKDRRTQQAAYRLELQEMEDEIAHEKRLLKEAEEAEGQRTTLQQHRADLNALRETRERLKAMKKAEEAVKSAATPPNDTPRSTSKNTNKDKESAGFEAGSPEEEWEDMKRVDLAKSEAMDMLMGLVGLEDVKREFLNIKSTVDTAMRQGVSTKSERFGCSLLGNPGTGKTTVARLYAKFLTSMGVIAGSCFKETTGSKLANIGITGVQKLLDEVLDVGGGVIFIDEAYQLSSGNSPGGRAVIDFLLAEIENLNSKICFVLAGYTKQMEQFFTHNPGLPSRFPREMKFKDYSDEELLKILELKVNSKFGRRMKAQDGLRGVYFRIVARRIGRGRGKEGFGNARAAENALLKIYQRQSERLTRERHARPKPDYLLLTKEDLIGPEPGDALLKSAAWGNLEKLIGLDLVKKSVKSLVDSIRMNYQRELNEDPIIEYSLNRIFLGNPGTGKTTVAKLYGEILVDLGLLSNGEVIVKNPSDFVGSALGQSEQQTKGILAASVGKVLVIDEAYGLYGGGASQGGRFSDPYKTAVVDTIVAEVQSVPGDDRCVLLLGYKDHMEEMLQNVNPGLSRRFPLASGFVFEDFTQGELKVILDMKLKKQGFAATDTAKRVALEMLDRTRNRPNFGNAGEIDILLNEAMSRHQNRISAGKSQRVSTLEALDFDENFDRLERSETNVASLFKDTVGCERLVGILQGYQETARKMKTLGLDPKEDIPFNFLFRGPPGTGKSATAHKMGKVFYDAGFLASCEVIDCSASDITGQYVGQTGPKVRQQLDKALGRVLLIDEAYRLAEGHFAKEALDELVDAMTKEKYQKRLVIILAGYENDINRLLNANPGLTSRFPECIDFHGLTPGDCFDLLAKSLLKRKILLEEQGKGSMDVTSLVAPSTKFRDQVVQAFCSLSKFPTWASARDVKTLAQSVQRVAVNVSPVQNPGAAVIVSEAMVVAEMERMIMDRKSGAKQSTPGLIERLSHLQSQPLEPQLQPQKPSIASAQKTTIEMAGRVEKQQQDTLSSDDPEPGYDSESPSNRGTSAVRDAGVSDEVWAQLQKDAETEERREQEYRAKLKAKRDAADDELRERIIKELIEEEERRTKEAEARKKLELEGRCPVGYHWIRQQGGWRCAGGSHYVADGEV